GPRKRLLRTFCRCPHRSQWPIDERSERLDSGRVLLLHPGRRVPKTILPGGKSLSELSLNRGPLMGQWRRLSVSLVSSLFRVRAAVIKSTQALPSGPVAVGLNRAESSVSRLRMRCERKDSVGYLD